MLRFRLLPIAMVLASGFSVLGSGRAEADIVVTLQGVTFADGGTASGSFILDVYGYPVAAEITTTPGISMNGQPLAGYTYTLAGNLVPSSPGPFDSKFIFYSTPAYFSLVLEVAEPIVAGISGLDILVPGSGSGNTLVGSYENCVQNAVACGGAAYLDGRLITSGLLYTPEPGTTGLVGVGVAVLALVRRRRTRVARDTT